MTCSNLPDWEVDDIPLHGALASLGVDVETPCWDDPQVEWGRYEGCLIRTTWDYMEKRDDYVDWAERVGRTTPLFNPSSIVAWNTKKTYLRDLEERGAPTVPTVWIENGCSFSLREALREREWKKAFLKPVIGATARETMRFDASDDEQVEEAERHLERMRGRGEDMMLQPYLDRVETEGEISAIVIDGAITHTVRKIPVPGDYRVQDDFGASDEPTTFSGTELGIVCEVLDSIEGDLLYARADFLRDHEGKARLTELELVEPSLFFRHGPYAAERLAEALCDRVRNGA
ncbi:MAG: hypothetical protein ACF8PN_05650 [Phycisphaerales bacterium]